MWEKFYIWNPSTGNWENAEYLTSSVDDSMIACDETTNAADSVTFAWIKMYNCMFWCHSWRSEIFYFEHKYTKKQGWLLHCNTDSKTKKLVS